jgi:hypothetical protein
LTKKAGGKGANQAYALAKAGGGVVLDGCIGEDGVWVRKMLEGVGVGVERVRVVENEVGPLAYRPALACSRASRTYLIGYRSGDYSIRSGWREQYR